MKYSLIFFYIILSTTTLAWAKQELIPQKVCTEEACFDYIEGLDLHKYPFKSKTLKATIYIKSETLSNDACLDHDNCYLFLGQVADTFKLHINGNTLVNGLDDIMNFISYESTLVHIPNNFIDIEKNEIKIEIQDLTKSIWGIKSKMYFGKSSELYVTQVQDWFIRTGITLFSSYSLFLFLILSIFVYLLTKTTQSFFVAMYCFVALIYLISFSEIPRRFIDPEIASGAIHFPIRLLQDFVLFLTLQSVFDSKNRRNNNFFKAVSFLYILFILIFPIIYFIEKKDFNIFKNIIFIGAPLVAMPMAYGFYLSFKQVSGYERKILIPIFGILFALQLNDLFLFWQIVDSYYTVKFYIPLIVILLFTILILRFYYDYTEKNLLASKVLLTSQVTHDLKSPIMALDIVANSIDVSKKHKELLLKSTTRIKSIANDLFDEMKSQNKKYNLDEIFKDIIHEKNIEHHELKINFTSSLFGSFLTSSKPDLDRIISNIINNSVDAGATKVSIDITRTRRDLVIKIRDNGSGFQPGILKQLGYKSITTKGDQPDSGLGLGLFSAYRFIERWGGDLEATNLEKGALIEIKIPHNSSLFQ